MSCNLDENREHLEKRQRKDENTGISNEQYLASSSSSHISTLTEMPEMKPSLLTSNYINDTLIIKQSTININLNQNIISSKIHNKKKFTRQRSRSLVSFSNIDYMKGTIYQPDSQEILFW